MNKVFLDRRISYDTLNHLLDNGDWYFGLISKAGNVFSNTELWPQYPENSCGDIIWQNEYGELKPIAWFGTNNAIKDSCLAIFDRKTIKVDVGYDYMETIQAFSMDYVDDVILQKIDNNIESCPVDVARFDSESTILIKVTDYCYHMQKRYVLENALYEYGYNLCFSFVERPIDSCDFDDSVLLPDGRLTPSFICEWAYEQMSEDLYGDAQADMIEIDDRYFINEHEGDSSYAWNVLERYFNDVEEFTLKGLYQCLEDYYGKEWRTNGNNRKKLLPRK